MAERITRRTFLKAAGATAGAVALSPFLRDYGLSRDALAQTAGVLNYGMAGPFDSLDVTTTTFSRVGRIGLHMVDPLVWQVRSGQFAPGLATSWTISPDATSYTFKLRDDVKFHDGTPFDAEAVKVTYDRIVDPETRAQSALSLIGPYAGSDVIDKHTVRVRFRVPYATFLDSVSTPYLGINSPTAIRRYGRDYGRVVFVSSGPFMLARFTADAEVQLVRNPNYNWGARHFKHQGLAYLQRIVYKIVPEDPARMATLETGETHFIEDVPTSEYRRVKGLQNLNLIEIPQAGSGWSMMMNQTKAPTNELAVRRAVSLAIDRVGLCNTVWNGVFKPACSPLTPVMFGFDRNTCAQSNYDIAAARRVLEEAGWREGPGGIRVKDGQRLSLEIWIQNTSIKNLEMAQFIQASVRPAGIDIVIQNLARPPYFEGVRAGRHHVQYWWDTGSETASMLRTLFHSRNAGGGTNRSNYRSAEMDKLIDDIGGEPNLQKRRELIVRAQKKVMDDAVMVYLADPPALYAHTRNVRDVSVDWGGNLPYFYDTQVTGR
jgi:peptide/nickel transport system substrate-binding protein